MDPGSFIVIVIALVIIGMIQFINKRVQSKKENAPSRSATIYLKHPEDGTVSFQYADGTTEKLPVSKRVLRELPEENTLGTLTLIDHSFERFEWKGTTVSR